MYKSKTIISLATCGTTTQTKCPPKCEALKNEKKTIAMNNKTRLQEIEEEMTQLKCNTLCK